MKKILEKPFSCTLCQKSFSLSQALELAKHVELYHSITTKKQVISNNDSLNISLINSVPQATSTPKSIPNNKQNNSDESDLSLSFQGDFGQKSAQKMSNDASYLEEQNDFGGQSNAKILALKNEIKPRIPKDSKDVISCKFCSKTFNKISKLIKHEISHGEDKPFSCEFCQKSFKRKDHAKIHMRIHNGEKPFSCQFCQKSFTQKGHVQAHQKRGCEKMIFQDKNSIQNDVRNPEMKENNATNVNNIN